MNYNSVCELRWEESTTSPIAKSEKFNFLLTLYCNDKVTPKVKSQIQKLSAWQPFRCYVIIVLNRPQSYFHRITRRAILSDERTVFGRSCIVAMILVSCLCTVPVRVSRGSDSELTRGSSPHTSSPIHYCVQRYKAVHLFMYPSAPMLWSPFSFGGARFARERKRGP